jgi:cytosine deaminase
MADVLLRSVSLPDGFSADVTLAAGRIERVAPAGSLHQPDTAPVGATHDLSGWLLLPAPGEPHAHLDKALTADVVPNPDGDLMGAIVNYQARYHERTVDDIAERARRAALVNLAHGCTAVRTHVDIGPGIGLRGVEALLSLRDELADRVDLQIVGLVGRPTAGPDGEENRRLLIAALDAGIDVGGGCPHLDPDPKACLEACFDLARRYQRPLDLHMDEHLHPEHLDLEDLAALIRRSGYDRGATASHCVSLGLQDHDTQRRVADAVAAAGVSVVTLPQTNLFLQARGVRTSPPRGLTAVASLLDAGVNVAAGGDNLQDPFNTVGRGDPLEAASLLVSAGHLSTEQAYHAVSNAVRRALGLPELTVAPDQPAELLAIKAATVREAVAAAPADRLVFHQGRLVARTVTVREFPAG